MNLRYVITRYPKLFSSTLALFWVLQLAYCISHLDLRGDGGTRGLTGLTVLAAISLLFTNVFCLIPLGIFASEAFAPSKKTILDELPLLPEFTLYLVGVFLARVFAIRNASHLVDLALGAELFLVSVAAVFAVFYGMCVLIVKYVDGLAKEVASEHVPAPEPAPEPKPERLSRHVEAGILVALNDMRRIEYNYGARTLFVKRCEYYANTDVTNLLRKLTSNLTLPGNELRIDWGASTEQNNVRALAKLGYTLRYEEERAYLVWNGDEQREATDTQTPGEARRDDETCSAE